MSLKDLTRRAMALPPTGEGVEEIVRECLRWDPYYKRRIYSATASSTGMTFDEIGAIESEVRREIQEARHDKK